MTAAPEPQGPLTAEETAALLRRILADVDEDKRAHRLDILCALLLAVATLGSAWCTYQASAWVGNQIVALADASQSRREATTLQLDMEDKRIADAILMADYFDAEFHGDVKFADFLRQRMRPEGRRVIDDWLATNPQRNFETFPLHPLKSPDFVLPQAAEVKGKIERSEAQHASAVLATQRADEYFRLTVVFSAVLFFAGIGATFKARPLRWTVLAIAAACLAVGAVKLVALPVAWS